MMQALTFSELLLPTSTALLFPKLPTLQRNGSAPRSACGMPPSKWRQNGRCKKSTRLSWSVLPPPWLSYPAFFRRRCPYRRWAGPTSPLNSPPGARTTAKPRHTPSASTNALRARLSQKEQVRSTTPSSRVTRGHLCRTQVIDSGPCRNTQEKKSLNQVSWSRRARQATFL